MPQQQADNVATLPDNPPKYRPYTLNKLGQIPQLENLTEQQRFDIEVVAQVLPFRVNNYVVEELIDWEKAPNDPIFRLTFPQREMLTDEQYEAVANALKNKASKEELNAIVHQIRLDMNPHPAGQMEQNMPELDTEKLKGMQHKYHQTVLFFPSQGQTCHAYCTFCFRWPQFVGIGDWKFAMKETEKLLGYLAEHQEVSDVLFTGGDPMIMKTAAFKSYIEPLLEADPANLRSIRIGTKSLGYWPNRFTTDPDAQDMLDLFKKVVDSGRSLAFMAHFNHPAEMSTPEVKKAIDAIRATGAQIRTQSPLIAHINDDADAWAEMWQTQVEMGCIPYYMFVERDTGASHYFGVPLAKAWDIYRQAIKQVSGLARTVRGPSMSAGPGKIQVLGVEEVNGEKVFILTFLQGRNPDWVGRPFFAKYDEEAAWLDELYPAFGEEKFFFEDEYPLR